MEISTITTSNDHIVDLRQLRVLDVLLHECNLTKAANSLGLTQPAVSKTLKQLRNYFGDPLLVRVGNRMQPTPFAQDLAPDVRAILDRVTTLNAKYRPFEPATSSREFSFCVVDSGLVRLIPELLEHLTDVAPKIRLNVQRVEVDNLESRLESGQLDFAMGSYPSLTKQIRRQALWSIPYVSLVRRTHPCAGRRLNARAFARERHVLVSSAGTGHAHQRIEKLIETAIPPENIVCRLPSFIAATLVAARSDVVVTVPSSLAERVASQLDLVRIRPGLKLPVFDVSQYWHERFHREPGSRWIRQVFANLFSERRKGQ